MYDTRRPTLACCHLGQEGIVRRLAIFMATRNAANMPGRPEKCTEFQFHIGQKASLNVIDFTERKLIHYSSKTKDPQQKRTLEALIDGYRKGLVAVAWRRGLPVPLHVTKDT